MKVSAVKNVLVVEGRDLVVGARVYETTGFYVGKVVELKDGRVLVQREDVAKSRGFGHQVPLVHVYEVDDIEWR